MKFARCSLFYLILLLFVGTGTAGAQGSEVSNPYWFYETSVPISAVTTGDIDSDLLPELIIGTVDGLLLVLEENGDVIWELQLEGAISSIVHTQFKSQNSGIYVASTSGTVQHLDQEGQIIWQYSIPGSSNLAGGYGPFRLPMLAVGDVNGDDMSELIVSGADNLIYLLNAEGRLLWNYDIGRSLVSVLVEDLDGDGLVEIIPVPLRGGELHVLDGNGSLVWQTTTKGEIGLVEANDINGNGQAEIIVLTAAWNLYAFDGEGGVIWHNGDMALSSAHSNPQPGQMILTDLDADGHAEILAVSYLGNSPGIYAFTGTGEQRWYYPSSAAGPATRIVAGQLAESNNRGLLVAESVHGPILLFDSNGRLIAHYEAEDLTGVMSLRDLDGNGWAEIIAGTESGVLTLGATNVQERRKLWQLSVEGVVVDLNLADLDGDGSRSVVAGTQNGRVYAIDHNGKIFWEIALGAPVLSLATGDVDGDDREEVVVSTWSGSDSGHIHLLDSNRLLWSIWSNQPMMALYTNGDGILAGGGDLSGGELIHLDQHGVLIDSQSFTARVTSIGFSDDELMIGLQNGEVYTIQHDKSYLVQFELDGPVAAVDQGFAFTANGQLYGTVDDAAVPIQSEKFVKNIVQISPPLGVFSLIDSRLVDLISGDLVWEEDLRGRLTNFVLGPIVRDGPIVIILASDNELLHFYGWISNQPPLLTEPRLSETPTGYAYGIDVNDPDGDTVTIGLAVWDPSAESWLDQQVQQLQRGQGQLSWEVPSPFDTWDSAKDSRYRFTYDDGLNKGMTTPFIGPLNITTDPWYLYYGRYFAGALVVSLFFSISFLIIHRIRVRQQSPIGQAERAFRQLTVNRNCLLPRLRDMANDPEWTKDVLPHLPGLIRASGDTVLGNLVEGFHLLSNHADLQVEGLATMLRSLEEEPELDPSRNASQFYRLSYNALNVEDVSGIVGLKREFEIISSLEPQRFYLDDACKSLSELLVVFQALQNFLRVETSEDKKAYLAQTIEMLGRKKQQQGKNENISEQRIVEKIRAHWLNLTTQSFRTLQDKAALELTLRSRETMASDNTIIILDIMNKGPGPANNLKLETRRTLGPLIQLSSDAISQLAAGMKTQIKLEICSNHDSDIELDLVLHYDDRENSGKILYFNDTLRFTEIPKQFNYIPNPYTPGKPLQSGSPVFFGREDILSFVKDNLGQPGTENVIFLAGQRRMGKTSILKQIMDRLDRRIYAPVYLDCQALGIEGGLTGLLFDIVIEIESALAEQGLTIRVPSLSRLETNATHLFEKDFLPSVTESIGQRVLVLLLDEFEELGTRVGNGEIPPSIFGYLRHLMQHGDQTAFILVGARQVEELATNNWLAFLNVALNTKVSFLDVVAARNLIIKPTLSYGIVFDELAIDKMIRVTACHPYFLQLLCYVLIGFHNRERVNYISTRDVGWAMERVVELGDGHLSLLWADLDREEQTILIALSRLLRSNLRVDSRVIASYLSESGLKFDSAQVTRILADLTKKEFVRWASDESTGFEFKVDLIRLWIERFGPDINYVKQTFPSSVIT